MSTITNIIYFYLFIILLTSIILFYLNNRKFFKIFVKDVRLLRLAHYELMFILGILLALKLNYSSKNILMFSNINNIFYISSILIAIAFAWLYSIITNNIEDYEIDKVSNKNRPLIKYKINFEEYEKLKWPLLFFALIFSIKASFNVFIFILIFIGNYFLYSMPPFRLKRITFFSKLFISANSLILVMLGFIISSKISLYEIKTPFETLTPIFLIGFTAAINFIDIKDYEGDKKAGIKTLPVILGLKKSKFLIGLFFILTYFSFYFFFKNIYLIIPLITLGIIQFYLINKKNYNENHVLLFYLVSIIALIIYLIFYTKVFSIMFY